MGKWLLIIALGSLLVLAFDEGDSSPGYNQSQPLESGSRETAIPAQKPLPSLNTGYFQEDEPEAYPTFNGYGCSDDCSGHEAGYEWAEMHGIEDMDGCGGNSDSFIEGCQSYVEAMQGGGYYDDDYYY